MTPATESTRVSPRSVYGASKARGEQRVLRVCPAALIVRPGPTFDPWDSTDELTRALTSLELGVPVRMPMDEVIRPTYVPDLVNASLELLLDGERGIWHLANGGEATPYDLVVQAALLAGISTQTLIAVPGSSLHRAASRPQSRALRSERGEHLSPWVDALSRYVQERSVLRQTIAPHAGRTALA